MVKDTLGETMHHVLLAIKRAEAGRFDVCGSPLDDHLHLDTV